FETATTTPLTGFDAFLLFWPLPAAASTEIAPPTRKTTANPRWTIRMTETSLEKSGEAFPPHPPLVEMLTTHSTAAISKSSASRSHLFTSRPSLSGSRLLRAPVTAVAGCPAVGRQDLDLLVLDLEQSASGTDGERLHKARVAQTPGP